MCELVALEDKEWKAFRLSCLFDSIESAKGKSIDSLISGDGLPYVAASKRNNGVKGIYSLVGNACNVSKGNCIVLIMQGDGAAGWALYEPMDFVGMNGNVAVGYINEYMNRYTGLFIATCLRVNDEYYSHGRSWSLSRISRTSVMLPITSDGEPDWEYMEQYVKQAMQRLL